MTGGICSGVSPGLARFLLNVTDTVESVANVDEFVYLPDGSIWALTVFAVDEVRRLLEMWRDAGEVLNGSYFRVVDQLIAFLTRRRRAIHP